MCKKYYKVDSFFKNFFSNPKSMQGKSWTFTKFSDTDWLWSPDNLDELEYAVWQLEECPETGRLHYQGYLRLKNNAWQKRVQTHFLCDASCHVEIAKGNAHQNTEYCTKEGRKDGPWIVGVAPTSSQGKRTDLLAATEMIAEGASMRTLAETMPTTYVRYERGLRSLQQTLGQTNAMRQLSVEVHWGAPGTGKTRQAYERFPNLYRWPGSKWFDGYNGQETLLLDDFYGKGITYEDLLHLLDIYPITREVKGSMVQARWTTVIITSNKPIQAWYPEEEEIEALTRRIHVKIHYPGVRANSVQSATNPNFVGMG